VIIDFHTHIFPPDVRERREEYLRRDPTFAEMYASAKAKIATAEDLLRSMDESGVDVSVALGFAWRGHEDCVRHNDYLLAAAASSGGRIVPFCTLNPASGKATAEVERCALAGARGLGELRPESQGWDLDGAPGDLLAELARKHNLVLLLHVTEPAGHDYPGKRGLSLDSFRRFLARSQGVAVVGAHLAGGLPLNDPPRAEAFADTAALRLLYEPALLAELGKAAWAALLLFGSDFPLVAQTLALADVRESGLDSAALARVLGGNARGLLPPAGE
jgi:predicted TIM-barrel fold metal-dependent hydrolase